MKRTHYLKIWPEDFDLIYRDLKQFLVQRDDQGFMVGDTVKLQEWDPAKLPPVGAFTGREIKATIMHKQHGGREGISEFFCILAISKNRK